MSGREHIPSALRKCPFCHRRFRALTPENFMSELAYHMISHGASSGERKPPRLRAVDGLGTRHG